MHVVPALQHVFDHQTLSAFGLALLLPLLGDPSLQNPVLSLHHQSLVDVLEVLRALQVIVGRVLPRLLVSDRGLLQLTGDPSLPRLGEVELVVALGVLGLEGNTG